MIDTLRKAPASLLLLFLCFGALTLGGEVLQHLSLTRWAALITATGFDPTAAGVIRVRDLMRFQGSDFFGAGVFLLNAVIQRGEGKPLRASLMPTMLILVGLEAVQMAWRWAPPDWMDLLAYALGMLLTLGCLQLVRSVTAAHRADGVSGSDGSPSPR